MVHIYTDGSVIGNIGPGGWGAVIVRGDSSKELSGSNPCTSITEMEIVAAIEALRSLPLSQRVRLRSDSRYLIEGMRYLARRWQSNGWTNSRGVAVQHQELWGQLMALSRRHRSEWKWLQGHNGHPIQRRADCLAYQEARAIGRTWTIAA